ncbi:MAG: phosphatidate cytidylyltransferase [Balneolaceae bacterium]
MSDLTRRLLFALPAGVLFLWLFWVGGVSLYVILGLLSLAGVIEMVWMVRRWQPSTSMALSILSALLLWASPWMPSPLWMVLGGLLILALLSRVIRPGAIVQNWEMSLFCGLYAPVGLYAVWLVRSLSSEMEGFWLALTLLLMIWGNDTAAFVGGKRFGRRKLAPAISPNKTWEGFYSGMVGSVLVGSLLWLFADGYPLPLASGLPLAILVSVAGPAGDLLASSWKRKAGIKDSSGLFPGHGGMMDRFDSLILAAPICWLYLQIWFR